MIFALSAVPETMSLSCVSSASLICAVSDDVDKRDSESHLHPCDFSGPTRCSAGEEMIVIINGDEIRVSWWLSVPSHDEAPSKRCVHREVTGVPRAEYANSGQRITDCDSRWRLRHPKSFPKSQKWDCCRNHKTGRTRPCRSQRNRRYCIWLALRGTANA